MRDKDRAEELAKAIEEMVQGRTPGDLDDEELQGLLQIAKIRLDAARLAAQAGTDAQSEVLQRILRRLASSANGPKGEPNGHPATNSASNVEDDSEVRQLQHIIGLRRRMAEHAAAIGESHREAVWQRVEARLEAGRTERRGLFKRLFGRRQPQAQELGAALDRMILGEPIWEAEDSRLDELLRVARLRRAAALSARSASEDGQERIWALLRPRLIDGLKRSQRPQAAPRAAALWRPRLAALGAAAAIVLAAVGPIPATGLADHPVAGLARFLGERIGVSETSGPPAVPPVTQVVAGVRATAEEAGALLGLPVYEPTDVPTGYRQASSQYFPEAITAPEGGMLVIAYENPDAAETPQLTVYQERISAASIAAERGSTQSVQLPDGTPATYVRGAWQAAADGLAWGEDGSSTLVFDLNGLRTIVSTTDVSLTPTDLMQVAAGLAAQAAPTP